MWHSATRATGQAPRGHFEQALQVCAALAKQHPGDSSFKSDLASVFGEEGAAMVRSGRLDEAEKALKQSLDYSRAMLASDPDDAAQRLVTAAASEWLAAIAHSAASGLTPNNCGTRPSRIRKDLALLESRNVPAQASLALALAHSGRRDEALKNAEAILKTNADRPAVLVSLAACFAACAASARMMVIVAALWRWRSTNWARPFATATVIPSQSGPSLTSPHSFPMPVSRSWSMASSLDR